MKLAVACMIDFIKIIFTAAWMISNWTISGVGAEVRCLRRFTFPWHSDRGRSVLSYFEILGQDWNIENIDSWCCFKLNYTQPTTHSRSCPCLASAPQGDSPSLLKPRPPSALPHVATSCRGGGSRPRPPPPCRPTPRLPPLSTRLAN
jgi:hypothetical protein